MKWNNNAANAAVCPTPQPLHIKMNKIELNTCNAKQFISQDFDYITNHCVCMLNIQG